VALVVGGRVERTGRVHLAGGDSAGLFGGGARHEGFGGAGQEEGAVGDGAGGHPGIGHAPVHIEEQ
jgi:hypothetical protein